MLKDNKSIKILKEGHNLKKNEITNNQKKSKTRAIVMYIIPLIALVIVAIAYILFQKNVLLIIFGVLMFIVLWGWDSSSRTCPRCKKWNSVIWTKNERRARKTNVKKRSIVNKQKTKTVEQKYTRVAGKCKNCGCEYETEKGRII